MIQRYRRADVAVVVLYCRGDLYFRATKSEALINGIFFNSDSHTGHCFAESFTQLAHNRQIARPCAPRRHSFSSLLKCSDPGHVLRNAS